MESMSWSCAVQVAILWRGVAARRAIAQVVNTLRTAPLSRPLLSAPVCLSDATNAAALELAGAGAAQAPCGRTCAAARIVIALKGQRASHRLQPVQGSASTSTASFVHRSV
jgi:hypothetical protein